MTARFILENGRVSRVHSTGKVTFATVVVHGFRAGVLDYFDVTIFSDGPALAEGAAVTVKGQLSRRKPRDGGNKWTTELIAREVKAAEDELCPAMPQRAPREEVPPPDDSNIPF